MHDDINLSVVGFNRFCDFLDSVSRETGVTFVSLYLFWDILGSIKHGIQWVDLLNCHLRAIGMDAVFIECSLLHPHFKNLENWRPGSDNDGGPGCRQGLSNSPSVPRGVSNTSNECYLSLQVHSSAH